MYETKWLEIRDLEALLLLCDLVMLHVNNSFLFFLFAPFLHLRVFLIVHFFSCK